jgi:hypothetical protein
MPSLPLDPRPDRAPLHPTAAPPTEQDAGARAPESVPVDPADERARWSDRRTGLIALVVVTIALWAVIAAAVGFATTM